MSGQYDLRVRRSLNTAWVIVIALVALGVGGYVLFALGSGTGPWAVLWSQVGAAIIVSVALGLIWDFWGRRSFTAEVLEQVGASVDVDRLGIRSLPMSFQGLDWKTFFEGARQVDILVIYAQTWRGVVSAPLDAFLSSKSNRLRFCLPDPECDWLMESLAKRLDSKPDEVRRKILESAAEISGLRGAGRGRAKIQLYFRAGEPLYGAYVSESAAVLTLYPHRKEKGSVVPTTVLGRGELHTFAKTDFDEALKEAREVSDEHIQTLAAG